MVGGKPTSPVPPCATWWITSDTAERAAVLDWQRGYVLYQGLGWAVAASEGRGGDRPCRRRIRAIETAVATTIIGSLDEVIDGLHQVADAGVNDVVLRIASKVPHRQRSTR